MAANEGNLGFGLMRLPRRGVKIDVDQVAQMVDLFLDAGFTYFDTARVYPGSEAATRKALVNRHPRDSFTIATKLNTMIAPTAKLARSVDFVQLQINYADWENDRITSRANYEVARAHGKPIVIMEPVKGGALAKPAPEIRKLMDEAAPGASYASWAIRFAAGLDGIMAVLSGMSNVEQMVDNLSYMRDFKPLDEREMAVIQQAREILGNARNIPCTACRYCVDGCPRHILIPDVFAAMNKQLVGGQLEEARADYRAAIDAGNFASACIACGRCEDVCPQNIEIISQLRECVTALEP